MQAPLNFQFAGQQEMRPLSKQEAEAWCEEHAISLNGRRLPDASSGNDFEIPKDAGARVSLVVRQLEQYGEVAPLFT
jgi:hypothetical protein